MKITINEDKKELEINYPCLMIADDGTIVLFTDDSIGVQLTDCPHYYIGYFSKTWNMGRYKLFNGSVTLSND